MTFENFGTEKLKKISTKFVVNLDDLSFKIRHEKSLDLYFFKNIGVNYKTQSCLIKPTVLRKKMKNSKITFKADQSRVFCL